MLDQLIIEEKESLTDFDASVTESATNPPEKKSVKEKVPFSNIVYDFSAINGEVYWEERKLEYVFEITADSPQELEQKKTAFSSWVMSAQNAKIYDPYIEDYHFIATFDSIKFKDEEHKEKTTATVTFAAYPYKVANKPKVFAFSVDASGEKTVTIFNESSHRMTPNIKTDIALNIATENASFSIPEGETKDDIFKLSVGANVLTIQNTSETAGNITISFYEEVF